MSTAKGNCSENGADFDMVSHFLNGTGGRRGSGDPSSLSGPWLVTRCLAIQAPEQTVMLLEMDRQKIVHLCEQAGCSGDIRPGRNTALLQTMCLR
ncbi:UNVERIFIED_CONTAM: hypothetical protein FKN15_019783 [Acipenser sinensis]